MLGKIPLNGQQTYDRMLKITWNRKIRPKGVVCLLQYYFGLLKAR